MQVLLHLSPFPDSYFHVVSQPLRGHLSLLGHCAKLECFGKCFASLKLVPKAKVLQWTPSVSPFFLLTVSVLPSQFSLFQALTEGTEVGNFQS